MFVCSFHLYSCFCFHYLACVFYIVMFVFAFVYDVILCVMTFVSLFVVHLFVGAGWYRWMLTTYV